MATPNYIRQDSRGLITINCAELPEKGFMDAVKTKDIIKFSILSRSKKAASQDYTPGSPDVVVKSLSGGTRLMYRKDIIKNYIFADGRHIRMSILKDDKDYIAYNTCKETYKMLKLPNNCEAILPNGTKARPGSYIIASVDENEQVDKSTITSISPSNFRKMFKVPMQPVLKRCMDNNQRREKTNTNKMFKLFRRNNDRSRQQNMMRQPRFTQAQTQMQAQAQTRQQIQRPMTSVQTENGAQQNTNMWRPTIHREEQNNRYRFKVTAQLVDMNGKEIGFVLQEIASGKTKNISTNELMQYCKMKSVENVMLVQNQNGVLYLRGNNCNIKSLPKVMR